MTKNEMIEQTWLFWNKDWKKYCRNGSPGLKYEYSAMVCGHLFLQFTGTFPYDFKTLEDLQTWLNGD